MANKKIDFGFFGKDNGVATTLDKIGEAALDAAADTSKLAAGQLELREAALNAKRAEDSLTAAQEKATRISKVSAATDRDKMRAALSVEAAEIKYEKALLQVATAGDKARKSVSEMGEETERAGDKVGKSSKGFASFGSKIGGGLKAGFSTGIGALPAIAAVGGALVGAAFIKSFTKVLDYKEARAKLKVQLDLNAKESEAAGRTAADLYKHAYGTGMEQVNEAIRSVVQNGAVLHGTMSKDLDDVAGKVLNLANTFDQDLGATTRAVGQMIRTGMAKDGAQALDILTKGFQSGADKSEDLLDTFNEYPTQFRRLGLDGATAMGLISQGLKAGARDSDIAADALKEFGIRAIDGSKTTADGFKRLGLNADEMAAKISRGGKDAADGLDITLDALRKIEDPAKRAQIAVELFGTQSEDMAAALGAMDPSTAVDALGKVGGAADRMGKDLTTPRAKLEGLKRTLELKVQGWLVTAFDWFVKNRLEIEDGLLSVAEAGAALIGPMADIAAKALYLGAGLLYVAGAAKAAHGDFKGAADLFSTAKGMQDQAGQAHRLGKEVQDNAIKQIQKLRGEIAAVRGKEVEVKARENATAMAARVRAAMSKVPANKLVTIQVTSSGTVQSVQREINSITGKVVSIQVGSVVNGKRGYADGGLVRGEGGPRDDRIPAMLSDKEYIMPADKTAQYFPVLEAMREGRIAMMANGGTVNGKAAMWSGGGNSGAMQPIVIQLDRKVIWQGLVALRRDVGALGLS